MYKFLKNTLIFLTLLSIYSIGFPSTNSYTGLAFDLESEELLYIEEHFETFNNQELVKDEVTYRHTNKKIFAKKTLNYGSSKYSPEFELKDLRSNYSQGVAFNSSDSIQLFRTKNDKFKNKKFKIKKPIIVDAGFDLFLKNNWQPLVNGNAIKFLFAAPGELSIFTFKVEKLNQIDFQGNNCLMMNMSLNSLILSWLVDPIKLGYDLDTKKLIYYQGISDIKNNDGKNHHVKIYYPSRIKNPTKQLLIYKKLWK